MQQRVTDVERLKKKVRKMAAGKVLAGGSADACLDLARMQGCTARIAAGYGPLSNKPQILTRDRLIWILDGYAEAHDSGGQVTHISQGESTVLPGGKAVRLVFPQLTIYLSLEAKAES